MKIIKFNKYDNIYFIIDIKKYNFEELQETKKNIEKLTNGKYFLEKEQKISLKAIYRNVVAEIKKFLLKEKNEKK